MKANQFEKKMRRLESYHGMYVPDSCYPILRVDGRAFTGLTARANFTKPFDEIFRDYMIAVAETMLTELGGIYAYTESDEISLVLPYSTELFNRSLEKLISVSAGLASAVFTQKANIIGHFDSRVIVAPSAETAIDYMRWRQADAFRCCLNGWTYWVLRQDGLSPRAATKLLEGKGTNYKNELLFQHGINFTKLPPWQCRGVGVYWEMYQKKGYNPILKQSVTTERRRNRVNMELPMDDEYSDFLEGLLRLGGVIV